MSEQIEIDGVKYDVLWKQAAQAVVRVGPELHRAYCFCEEWIFAEDNHIPHAMTESLLSDLAAAREQIAKLADTCEETMNVVDDCYESTGHTHVGPASKQRILIEDGIKAARHAAK